MKGETGEDNKAILRDLRKQGITQFPLANYLKEMSKFLSMHKNLFAIAIYLLLFICLLVETSGISPKPTEEISGNWLQEEVNVWMSENDVIGGAVSYITADTQYIATGGVIKSGSEVLVRPDHKFHLGSCSKAVTSWLIMRQVEAGNLHLDSSLASLVDFPIKAAYQDKKLKDVLSHQASIPSFTDGKDFGVLPEMEGTALENRANFAEFVLNMPPLKKTKYSNAGYALAAHILEETTGKPLEMQLEAEMERLGVEYGISFPNRADTLQPWGHWWEGKTLVSHGPDHPYHLPDFMLSAGDMAMDIESFSRWLQIQLLALDGKGNFLGQEFAETLHFGRKEYALGWGNGSWKGQRVSEHDGSAGTYFCAAFLLPDTDQAVAIMINSATREQINGVKKLAKKIMEQAGQ